MDAFPVRVIITGIEHSGTTLLSRLLKQDPGLRSGFECGFLLADTPRDFMNIHPWYEWMQEPVSAHQWGVSSKHMEQICSAGSWEEMYRRLIHFSPVFDQSSHQQVCDKTPRYLSCLDTVLEKLPDFVPCLVIEKDIENLWLSHKKRNAGLDSFCRMYEKYCTGLRYALEKHPARVHRINYEELCHNLDGQLKNVFSIIGLPFRAEYTVAFKERIRNYTNGNKSSYPDISSNESARLKELERRVSIH